MTADLTRARKRLAEGDITCSVCKGDILYTTCERGVKPLIEWLSAPVDLRGFSAADKAVGKAAAMLYVLLGVAAVYAPVMSEPARAVLEAHGIAAVWDVMTPAIRNRTDTGFCPMEQTVWEIDDPQSALCAIREKLAGMM